MDLIEFNSDGYDKLGILLWAIGGTAFSVYGIDLLLQIKRLKENGLKKIGIIRNIYTETGHEEDQHYPEIELVVNNEALLLRSNVSANFDLYKVGDEVNVIHEPGNLRNFIIDNNNTVNKAWLATVVGILSLIIAVAWAITEFTS